MLVHTDIEKAIQLLRNDAIDRGMDDLAIAYGWSLIGMRQRRLDEMMRNART